jgi:transposase
MESSKPECPGCRELRGIVEELRGLIEGQQQRIVDLEARLKKTSRNSSRPPSSDPPGAPSSPKRKSSGKKRGGQPGHEGHHRPLLAESDVARILPRFPSNCGRCGGSLPPNADGKPVRRQIWELPALRPHVTEYQFHGVVCPCCGERTMAVAGPDVPEGDFGPRAEATIAHLGAAFRLSVRERKRILAECWGLPISTGAIKRVDDRVSARAESVYTEALEALREAPVAHSDETSWRILARRGWLWTGVARDLRVFRVDRHRSREAFERLFGADFHGTLITDRLASYDGQSEDDRQLCWAHLKRDFQGFADRQDPLVRTFGERGLAVVKILFKEWRAFRDRHGDRDRLRRGLRPARKRLAGLLTSGAETGHVKIVGFCNHLIKRAGALWAFIDIDGVEPTNNPAERALRPAVLWRKGSFGSQSDSGCRFVERMLTIVSTLRAQGRPLLEFITELCSAPLRGVGPPSILTPAGS